MVMGIFKSFNSTHRLNTVRRMGGVLPSAPVGLVKRELEYAGLEAP
jgi:hypothetical protein